MKTYSEFVLTDSTDGYWFATVTETKTSFFKKESKRVKIFKARFSSYWRNLETGKHFDIHSGIHELEQAYKAKEELGGKIYDKT